MTTGPDRGVSVAVSHVLSVAITTLLISGLAIAAGGLVADQGERASREELETIGERLATELTRVDQLAAGDPDTTVTLATDHPPAVVGSPYEVRLTTPAGPCSPSSCLVLSTAAMRVDVRIPLALESPVVASTASEDRLRIVYDGTAIRIENGGVA